MRAGCQTLKCGSKTVLNWESALGFVVSQSFPFCQLGRSAHLTGFLLRGISWSVASHTPPTGDLAHNPGTHPDWELNQQPFNLQANAQSPEPLQPGLVFYWQINETMAVKSLLMYILEQWIVNFFLVWGFSFLPVFSQLKIIWFVFLLHFYLHRM